eukprot:1087156-Pleurochrysis_carterae.AAC.1
MAKKRITRHADSEDIRRSHSYIYFSARLSLQFRRMYVKELFRVIMGVPNITSKLLMDTWHFGMSADGALMPLTHSYLVRCPSHSLAARIYAAMTRSKLDGDAFSSSKQCQTRNSRHHNIHAPSCIPAWSLPFLLSATILKLGQLHSS